MQEAEEAPPARRSNEQRTRATRAALVTAARTLFVERGYAATSTPQIAAAAAVTRGALYHHFVDKQDLFRAVVEQEAAAVAAEIEASDSAAHDDTSARALVPDGARETRAADQGPHAARQLSAGASAYLDAMAVPGRTRLLLVDAPAVLGAEEADALDARHARRTLRAGLDAALVPHDAALAPARLDALTLLLSAAFDRAALALHHAASGPPESPVATADGAAATEDSIRWAVADLVERVCAPPPRPASDAAPASPSDEAAGVTRAR